MSLYVEGLRAASVAFSAVPRSSISANFAACLPPRRSSYFGFTTVAGPYASLSTVLYCDISGHGSTDVVLGLDWASMIRENLLREGHRLDHTFDPWAYFISVRNCPLPLHCRPFTCLLDPPRPLIMGLLSLFIPGQWLVPAIPPFILISIRPQFRLLIHRRGTRRKPAYLAKILL
ncbi:hypothetical protein B0H16DRAFT_1718593 [Mycena metata]|uniref:Uncharacterized protein n=1 Tax=Mycena metata TaxID=1033252 RepID=A0AAD7JFI0_9AGAR|nr:hypothetical protein B0H16DRAFT_1718593 [Mycena metata]